MKKLFYSLFVAFGAMTMASCSVDNTTNGTFGVNGNHTVTLNASVDHTRTSFNGGTHQLGWAEGDTYDVVAVNAAGEFLAHFGNLPFDNATVELPEGTDQLYAYYPPVYDAMEEEFVEVKSLDDIFFNLYGANPDSTDPEYSSPLERSIPMAAKAKVSGSEVAITFKTLVSIVELNVYGDESVAGKTIGSYALVAEDSETILSGYNFTVDWTQDELALTADEYMGGNYLMNYTDPANEPTVGTSKANGTKLYTTLPRGVYENITVHIEVYDADGEFAFDYETLDMTVFGRTLNINLSTGAEEDYLQGFLYNEADSFSGFDPENVEFKVLTEEDAEAENLAEEFGTYRNAQFYKITYKKNPAKIIGYNATRTYGMFSGALPEDSWEDDGDVEYYVSYQVNPWSLNDILPAEEGVANLPLGDGTYVQFNFDFNVPTAENHVATITITQSWQPVAFVVVDFAYAEEEEQGGNEEVGDMTFTLTPSAQTTSSYTLTVEPSGDSYYGVYQYHSTKADDLEGAKEYFNSYILNSTRDSEEVYQGTKSFNYSSYNYYVYDVIVVFNCPASGKVTTEFDECTVFEYDYATAGGTAGGGSVDRDSVKFTFEYGKMVGGDVDITVTPEPSDISYVAGFMRDDRAEYPGEILRSIANWEVYSVKDGNLEGVAAGFGVRSGTSVVNAMFLSEGLKCYAYAILVENGKYTNKIVYEEFTYTEGNGGGNTEEPTVNFSFAFNAGNVLSCTVTPTSSDAKWTGYLFDKATIDFYGSAEWTLQNMMLDNYPGGRAYSAYTGTDTVEHYYGDSPVNGTEYVMVVMPVDANGNNGNIIEEHFTYGDAGSDGELTFTVSVTAPVGDKWGDFEYVVTPSNMNVEYVCHYVYEGSLYGQSVLEYITNNNQWNYGIGNQVPLGTIRSSRATGVKNGSVSGSFSVDPDSESENEFFLVLIPTDGKLPPSYTGEPIIKRYAYSWDADTATGTVTEVE